MRAALYLRKSSPDERDAADGKSIAVQESKCRALAASQGFAVLDEHVYVDGDPDGLSGTILTSHRPAGRRLLDAAASKLFDVLIVAEHSRLRRNRDDKVITTLIKKYKRRLFYAETGHEVDLGSTMKAFVEEDVNGMVSQAYAEFISGKVAAKNRDTNARGHADGRRVYGYCTVEVGGHREYRIDDTQAAVVKRIFQLAAEGVGDRRICDILTSENVPAPARAKGWAKGIIREMLLQEMYIGKLVYDKSHVVGKKEHRAEDGTVTMINDIERITDRTLWKRADVPHLAFISPELWAKVQARKEQTRAAYIRSADGKLQSKPETGLAAEHLLNGFLRCGICGASMTFKNKKGAIRRYYCIAHENRGRATCPNGRGVPEKPLDDLVKAKLLEVLGDEDTIAELIEESAERHAREHAATSDVRANLEAEAARLESVVAGLLDDLEHLSAAAKQATRERLNQRTVELEAVRAKLAEPAPVKVDKVAVVEGLRRAGLMFATELPGIRAAFRKLGCERITATPDPDGSWTIAGGLDLSGIISGVTFRPARGV